ncbi:MAG: galactokinase [Bdellovibrionales bacterium]|nr:galactokinase [Bdellovibrionales bacterium]NQZ19725.1 galactokinase [Bdellovibrionales bacterium]
MQNEVFVKSPTRIDLAGGTLDCWPINAAMNPVSTINVAISIYTACKITKRTDTKISVYSKEWDTRFEFDNLEAAMKSEDEHFLFFREHISYWQPDYGFDLEASSESPVGGGLGGSSSLSVSIFKAFAEMNGVEMDTYETVRLCSGIEAKILKTPTGTQDYFPPLLKGINIIDYEFGWPKVSVLPVNTCEISKNISIFFTGKAHNSGINNWQVIKKFLDGDEQTSNALASIQDIAEQTKEAVRASNWEKLPQLFKDEFQARLDLADCFTSPEIEKLAEVAMANGGDAIKICGAGGGGCVFIWSAPEKRQSVIEACQEAGFKHLDVELV